MERAKVQAQHLKLAGQIKIEELKIGSVDRALGKALLLLAMSFFGGGNDGGEMSFSEAGATEATEEGGGKEKGNRSRY